MDYTRYQLTDSQLHAVEETRRNFRLFHEDPSKARPAILIHPPVASPYSIRQYFDVMDLSDAVVSMFEYQ